MCDFIKFDTKLKDPSLVEGCEVLYKNNCKVEVKYKGSLQGEIMNLTFRLIGNEHLIKLELTSETDLFFYFIHRIDSKSFEDIKTAQNLTIDFVNYSETIIKMVNSCIDSSSFSCILYINGDLGVLKFFQNMDYREMELLECAFRREDEFKTAENITYRYNYTKEILGHYKRRLEEFYTLVKRKDPQIVQNKLFGRPCPHFLPK
ncbi:hypothetical protein BEWA_000290 [Theileria equi strain WA]|uniref:Spindle assembly abnormal protein 6 N-terminal domain-containing protein n=1 Tax=Theileria equi strain WA TaxID=1537102 RepID=L0B0G0_THEEQ|nr:hypothetical protein BEWA_000290 [Theileria equi strain WA]AFZ80624.1 hypothetical protein BEWA_000290 [Theileria equi strain WA]|eukprot:XP_004830290.1 hypothetical protein BEWA_000290 [Theileria equi strain WA]